MAKDEEDYLFASLCDGKALRTYAPLPIILYL